MLDLAAILLLAQTCAPQTAPATLAAVAWAESRFDPLAIGVNRGPRPARPPRDAADAARIARDLLARGANLDLGVAQINSDNLDRLGLTPEAAFDPCSNLAAADRILRAGYRPGPDRTPQQTLRIALSRYNTGHPERGFRNGYVARVEAAAAALGLAPAGDAARQDPPATGDPPGPVAAWDVFGRAPASPSLVFTSTHSARGGQR